MRNEISVPIEFNAVDEIIELSESILSHDAGRVEVAIDGRDGYMIDRVHMVGSNER